MKTCWKRVTKAFSAKVHVNTSAGEGPAITGPYTAACVHAERDNERLVLSGWS
jgi:hypothetical protein